MTNRWFLLILHTISLVLLGFGWFLSILHMQISAHYIIDISLFDEKRSVISTLQKLWDSGNYTPFLLIFLFGILVPLSKSALIYWLLLAKTSNPRAYSFVNAISKWAMADVFAMSIFIAFLGANAMDHTKANLEAGFYYFAGYVVLSGIIVFLLGKRLKKGVGGWRLDVGGLD